MNVEELLDKLEDVLENSMSLPFSDKRLVDSGAIREVIDDINLNMPQELKQAKMIVSDRAEILQNAKRDSEGIVRSAEERARILVSQEEIIKQSQKKANDMLSVAQSKSREMRKAVTEFADSLLKASEDEMVVFITSLREQSKKFEEGCVAILSEYRAAIQKNDELMMQKISELRKLRQSLRNPRKFSEE